MYHGEELDGLNYQDLSTPVPLYSGMDFDDLSAKIKELRILGLRENSAILSELLLMRAEARMDPVADVHGPESIGQRLVGAAVAIHAWMLCDTYTQSSPAASGQPEHRDGVG
ncbi:MAG: hypothetical protein ACI9T8_000513 [Candidatus Saccharimonadales bacterium]